MLPGRTVFAQLMDHVSQTTFQTCVARYRGDHNASRFTCWDQYLCMAFAQLTYRESLRDIEACLRAVQSKLYHVGIRARVARSTLGNANEKRDWRIYGDFAQALIRTARDLYVDEPLAMDLQDTVYALDATIIELCLSVFPWAHYRRRDAAIKLHTLVDLRGVIPTVVQITPGKCPDVTALDDLMLEAGAIYIMDRGHVDFIRLCRFTEEAAFFVTRTKQDERRQLDLPPALPRLMYYWARIVASQSVQPPRHWRTRKDPFESAWPRVVTWLELEPDTTAKDLFKRLRDERPGDFPAGQLRTLQRRVKEWRPLAARRLVFSEPICVASAAPR